MNTQQKIPFRYLMPLIVAGIFLILALLQFVTPLRLVTTPSVPMGLYWATYGPIERGSYVDVRLPKELAVFGKSRGYLGWGFYGGWTQGVVKVVAGLPGDVLFFRQDGVWINGVLISNTATLSKDFKGRPLAHTEWNMFRVVQPGEVWLLSNYAVNSWDCRYYGAIPLNSIFSTLIPLWVME